MRIIILGLIIIINFVIQTTWLTYAEIFGIGPNTGIIIIVCMAFLRNHKEGAIIGFSAGFLRDIFFGNMLGLNALLYMLIGYASGSSFKEFYEENYFIPILLVGAATVFYNFSYYIFNFLFRARLDLFYYFGSIIIPETIYNITLTMPLYVVLYLINLKLEKHEKPLRKIFHK